MLALTMSMDVAEFVKIRGWSDATLRAHFHLPESCDPSLSATRRPYSNVEVALICIENAIEPGTRRPPPVGSAPSLR
jgi:hypothetical protein